jgi:hypothetical protein
LWCSASSKDQTSIPVDPAEDHAGQWVLRRVASNGYVSVDKQAFSVGNAYGRARCVGRAVQHQPAAPGAGDGHPAERFRLAPLSTDAISVPVDEHDDRADQWVLRRVGSNGYVSVDNQAFSVGKAFKGELVDVFEDPTTIQFWSKNHLIKTVTRVRSGPVREVRAGGLHVQHQPDTTRQASGGT